MSTTYHEKEIEIAGEKITAKYFEINFKVAEEEKYTLSDLWYDITLPFYKIKWKIRNIYWEIRYGFQRMFKYYDSVDTFGLCDKFIDRYHKILKAYKENLHGHPCHMTSEEWDEILDQLLFHLYYMDEDHVDEELQKDVPKNWLVTSWNCCGSIIRKPCVIVMGLMCQMKHPAMSF